MAVEALFPSKTYTNNYRASSTYNPNSLFWELSNYQNSTILGKTH